MPSPTGGASYDQNCKFGNSAASRRKDDSVLVPNSQAVDNGGCNVSQARVNVESITPTSVVSIPVYFIIAIPSSFAIKDRHKIYITGSLPEEMGDWGIMQPCTMIPLKTDYNNSAFHIFGVCVKIPRKCIDVQYKYALYDSKKPQDVIFETLVADRQSASYFCAEGTNINRCIHKIRDEWTYLVRLDGLVYFETDGGSMGSRIKEGISNLFGGKMAIEQLLSDASIQLAPRWTPGDGFVLPFNLNDLWSQQLPGLSAFTAATSMIRQLEKMLSYRATGYGFQKFKNCDNFIVTVVESTIESLEIDLTCRRSSPLQNAEVFLFVLMSLTNSQRTRWNTCRSGVTEKHFKRLIYVMGTNVVTGLRSSEPNDSTLAVYRSIVESLSGTDFAEELLEKFKNLLSRCSADTNYLALIAIYNITFCGMVPYQLPSFTGKVFDRGSWWFNNCYVMKYSDHAKTFRQVIFDEVNTDIIIALVAFHPLLISYGALFFQSASDFLKFCKMYTVSLHVVFGWIILNMDELMFTSVRTKQDATLVLMDKLCLDIDTFTPENVEYDNNRLDSLLGLGKLIIDKLHDHIQCRFDCTFLVRLLRNVMMIADGCIKWSRPIKCRSDYVSDIIRLVKAICKQFATRILNDAKLEHWRLLGIQLNTPELVQFWREWITETFLNLNMGLSSGNLMAEFLNHLQNTSDFPALVKSTMEKCIIERLQLTIEKNSKTAMSYLKKNHFMAQFVSKIIVDDCRGLDEDEELIRFCMKYDILPDVFKMEKDDIQFTSECKLLLDRICNIVMKMLDLTKTGQIQYRDYMVISESNSSAFLSLCGAMIDDIYGPNVSDMKRMFGSIKAYTCRFMDLQMSLKAWLEWVGSCWTDNWFDDINIVHAITNLTVGEGCGVTLKLCDIIDFNENGLEDKMFGLSMEFIDCVKKIRTMKDNITLRSMVKKNKLLSDEKLMINDFVSKMYRPACDQFENVLNDICSGQINLQQVSDLIGQYSTLKADLKSYYVNNAPEMKHPMSELEKGLLRIDEYIKVFQRTNATDELQRLRRELKLEKGDFETLDKLEKLTDKNKLVTLKLKDLTNEVMKASDFLEDITDDTLKAVNVFLKEREFIEWLSRSKNEQTMKTFIDIATPNAQHNEIQFTLLTRLGQVVNGYGPLIYRINENSNLNELLKYLRILVNELTKDPRLPDKLVLCAKHLDQLKDLQGVQGQMEKSAFMDLNVIINNGIFILGCQSTDSEIREDSNNFLKLKLSDSKSMPDGRIEFSLVELRELHSKLMLISSQISKDESSKTRIESFAHMFEGICSMVDLLIAHERAGNTFFDDWLCEFYCDVLRETPVLLQLGREGVDLSGVADDGNYDTYYYIKHMNTLLQRSLTEWFEYTQEMRGCHPTLNLYTNKQIVQLQRQMFDIRSNRGLTPQVAHLLMDVKSDISYMDIVTALRKRKLECFPTDTSCANGTVVLRSYSSASTASVAPLAKRSKPQGSVSSQDIFNAFSNKGIDDDVISNALKSLGIESDSSGSDTVTHDDEDSDAGESLAILENGSINGYDDETTLELPAGREWVRTNPMKEEKMVSDDSLLNELNKRWQKYIGSHKTSTLDGLLSMSQLGNLLHLIQSQQTKVDVVVPDWLLKSINFVVVDDKAQLELAVAVFQQCKPSQFPHSSEVLVCRSCTTTENVELFLRRYSQQGHPRLFVLIGVDRLTSAVQEQVISKMEVYLQSAKKLTGKQGRSTLFVSASTESCAISSYFVRYRCAIPAVQPKWSDIQKFIRRYLAVDSIGNLENPTAENLIQFYRICFVTSAGYGQGKSLTIDRLYDSLETNKPKRKIPVHSKQIDQRSLLLHMKPYMRLPIDTKRVLTHIDVTSHATENVEEFLFHLLLGHVEDRFGNVWKRLPSDYFVIEMTCTEAVIVNACNTEAAQSEHWNMMRFAVPFIVVHSPVACHQLLSRRASAIQDHPAFKVRVLDRKLLDTAQFQLSTKYLMRLRQGLACNDIDKEPNVTDSMIILDVLLERCGLTNPSWAELRNFVVFLYAQLSASEKNVYYQLAEEVDGLPGFQLFVLKFMIQMSRDFATRSLNISEDTSTLSNLEFADAYEISKKHRWEHTPHPYLFFNHDLSTFSFFGCNLERATGNLVDLTNNRVIEKRIASTDLIQRLFSYSPEMRKIISTPMDKYQRADLLQMLNRLLGTTDDTFDPDPLFELTPDCVLKMMAIEMRFRCDIPVIIMGETGCGKTRLIQFLCDLKRGTTNANVRNIFVMKLHSGITESQIYEMLCYAIEGANNNCRLYQMDTVLFFDEANTTRLISLIKEIMIDKSFNGEWLSLAISRLKIIAAVNPYRKHSEHILKKLAAAGLGYLDKQSDKRNEAFEDVSLRQLVYRVYPLPASLVPLVWDFGTLQDDTEALYVARMVEGFERRHPGILNLTTPQKKCMVEILCASQRFMRSQEDECSFVSLRDIDRAMKVFAFFYQFRDQFFSGGRVSPADEPIDDNQLNCNIEVFSKCLILALCVCYRSSLQKQRSSFDQMVAKHAGSQFSLPKGAETLGAVLVATQNVVLNYADMETNIAKNVALKENVFMMVVCIQLRIPLFVIGRPGSSKTLAKTIVKDSMQGNSSRGIFKNLKMAQIVPYQCSPSCTAEGVQDVFMHCTRLQKEWKDNLDKHVAVAVFDEIGLAEESAALPLKALHGFLEEGCKLPGELDFVDYHRSSFIGISNWALDPANMNRGIFVTRTLPTENELMETAISICSDDLQVLENMESVLEPITGAYLKIYDEQYEKQEFFGLRDFYSTIKAVFDMTRKNGKSPNYGQVMKAIAHNFGGRSRDDAINVFAAFLGSRMSVDESTDFDSFALIAENLVNRFDSGDHESRYLLLMTETDAVLGVVRKLPDLRDAEIIFGSSFPQDNSYIQLCRNVNRIKMCMAKGRTVVLLNLEDIYESLYDLLNQSFVKYADTRFVDLGLGTHRVRSEVDGNFKLVVVANYDYALDKFPIALLNRLEKHFISMTKHLGDEGHYLIKALEDWAHQFCSGGSNEFKPQDSFIGYVNDTPAVLIADLIGLDIDDDKTNVLNAAKERLLWTATPDALLRMRSSSDEEDLAFSWQIYFRKQNHSNLVGLIRCLDEELKNDSKMILLTTHGSLLSMALDVQQTLAEDTGRHIVGEDTVTILSLEKYCNEQDFIRDASMVFERARHDPQLLMVQCYPGDEFQRLIDCCRYRLEELWTSLSYKDSKITVIVAVSIPRVPTGCFKAFPVGLWLSVHLDDLEGHECGYVILQDKPLSQILDYCHESMLTGQESVINVTNTVQEIFSHAAPLLIDWNECAFERLELVRCLMGNDAFANALFKKVVDIQKVKENSNISWLTVQASKTSVVFETKTFSSALQRQASLELAPVMAGILAVIDNGFALNFAGDIKDSVDNSWKCNLLSECLKNTDLQSIIYESDAFHETVDDVRREKCSFKMIHPPSRFQFEMPFSWIVYTKLTDIVENEIQHRSEDQMDIDDDEMNGGDEIDEQLMILDRCLNSLQSSEWGKLVTSLFGDGQRSFNAFKCYLIDCVRLEYGSRSANFMLLCQEWIANEISDHNRHKFGFLCVHLVLQRKKREFKLFDNLCQLAPSLSDRMLSDDGRLKLVNSNMEMHLACVDVVLEMIEDQLDGLTDTTSMVDWISLIRDVGILIASDKVIATFDQIKSIRWTTLKLTRKIVEPLPFDIALGRILSIFEWSKQAVSIEREGSFFERLTTFIETEFLVGEDSCSNDIAVEILIGVVEFYREITDGKIRIEDIEALFPLLTTDYDEMMDEPGHLILNKIVCQRLFEVLVTTNANEFTTIFDNTMESVDIDEYSKCTLIDIALRQRDSKLGSHVLEQSMLLMQRCKAIDFDSINIQNVSEMSLSSLSNVAVARYTFMQFAKMIKIFITGSYEQNFLDTFETVSIVVHTILQPPQQKQFELRFLMRALDHEGGIDILKMVARNDQISWMLPSNIKNELERKDINDLLLVSGNGYHKAKELFRKAGVSDEQIEECLHGLNQPNPFLVSLAAFSCFSELPDQIGTRIVNKVHPFLLSSIAPTMSNVIFNQYLSNVKRIYNNAHAHILQLIIHTQLMTISNGSTSVVGFLNRLCNAPEMLANTLLPSMPMNPVAEVGILGDVLIFVCPNDHPFVIGECKRPMQQTECPACGSPIGGINHALAQNNRQADNLRQAQANDKGYCLLLRTSNQVVTQRQLTKVGTIVCRILIQLCLLSADSHGRNIIPLLPQNITNIKEFFYNLFIKDIRSLQTELGVGPDEVAIFMHLIIQRLALLTEQNANIDHVFNDNNSRSVWEECFVAKILNPVRQDFAKSLITVKKAIKEDKENCALFAILYEQGDDVDIRSYLWCDVLSNSTDDLLKLMNRQIDSSNNADQYKLIKTFETDKESLSVVKNLPDICKLMTMLYQYYRGYVDLVEIDKLTLRDFLKKLESRQDKIEFLRLFTIYFHTWKVLKPVMIKDKLFRLPVSLDIFNSNKSHAVQSFPVYPELIPDSRTDILKNPLIFCIPVAKHKGYAACMLVSKLIALQNDITEKAWTIAPQHVHQREVLVDSVKVNELIEFDENVRSALVLSRQPAQNEPFDLEALQRRFIHSVLKGGIRLAFAMPILQVKQEKINQWLTILNAKIEQTKVLAHVKQEVLRLCRELKRQSEVKSLCDITELLISFGSSMPVNSADKSLLDFVRANFCHKSFTPIVENVLKMAHMEHVNDLWNIALFERRYLLWVACIKRGQDVDVFVECEQGYKVPLDLSIKNTLKETLKTIDCFELIVSLTQLILIILPNDQKKARNVAEMKMIQTHDILTYLQMKADFEDLTDDHLSTDVLMENICDLWYVVVELFKVNNNI